VTGSRVQKSKCSSKLVAQISTKNEQIQLQSRITREGQTRYRPIYPSRQGRIKTVGGPIPKGHGGPPLPSPPLSGPPLFPPPLSSLPLPPVPSYALSLPSSSLLSLRSRRLNTARGAGVAL